MIKHFKPLIYIFVIVVIITSIMCYVEKKKNHCYTCNPVYCHVEVHADRPIQEIIQEIVRESESPRETAEREVQEMSSSNEWSSMS